MSVLNNGKYYNSEFSDDILARIAYIDKRINELDSMDNVSEEYIRLITERYLILSEGTL